MFTHVFHGGIHPKEYRNGKTVLKALPILEFLQPNKVVISLSQHLGAPSKCLVKKGDVVLKGQLIGEANGNVSANVHASISGKVLSVDKHIMPNGTQFMSVTIENDMTNSTVEYTPFNDVDSASKEDFINVIKNAGVVGMGGATFPTHVKLSSNEPIDTLLINGSECEPYLSSDHRLMLEHADTIIDGIKLVKQKLNIPKVVIGIEDNKQDAIDTLNRIIKSEDGIIIRKLKTMYPQGGEKQLIYACLGRKVPMGKLPLNVGVCVLNVGTCFAISQAIRLGKPLIDRVVTVAGSVNNPQNLLVPIGTLISDILEKCGGLAEDTKMIVYGGPMMGTTISTVDVPLLKGGSGIVALEIADKLFNESPCIHCGRCNYACPMKLVPSEIDRNVRIGHGEDNEELSVLNCLECGVCSYVCPAKRHLTHSCKYSKYLVRENIKRRAGDRK